MSSDPSSIAWDEARRRGWGHVGTELLLLGLASSDGPEGAVLADVGVTPEAIGGLFDQWDAAKLPERADDRPISHTPRAVRAFGFAAGFAAAEGRAERRSDLLVALIYDRDGAHVGILRPLGADRADLRRRLAARGNPVPSSEPPRDPDPWTDSIDVPEDAWSLVVEELSNRTVAGSAYVDEYGDGRWGYGVADDPTMTRISAAADLDIRRVVDEILRQAGRSGLADSR